MVRMARIVIVIFIEFLGDRSQVGIKKEGCAAPLYCSDIFCNLILVETIPSMNATDNAPFKNDSHALRSKAFSNDADMVVARK